MRFTRTFPLITVGLVGLAANAQTPFQPVPTASAPAYRFDYARTFFPSKAAADAAQRKMAAIVSEAESLKGTVISSPQSLYRAMSLSDDFSRIFDRLDAYYSLQYSTNTKDTASRDYEVKIGAEYPPRLTFIGIETQGLTAAKLKQYVAAYPPLKKYQYSLEQTLRYKPHTLSTKEEELLGKTGTLMSDWQNDEYDLLMDRADWGSVHDPDQGDLDVRRDASQIGNSLKRAVRKEGNDKTEAAFNAQRELFAFDFINVAKAQNALAKIHAFRNGQDSAFFGLQIPTSAVAGAYKQILAHGDIVKRMQRLKRDRIQAFTGFDQVHSYDQTLVPPGVTKPRFTIDQARDAIMASTAYLGPEYAAEMGALLNPGNGRLDLVPGANRVPNAFAVPLPGTKGVFYDYGYQGYVQDVSTLVHEGGHVVHGALENNAGVPPATYDGPRYFTEGYAILNELVLKDYLYRHETDRNLKVYYLESLLSQLLGFYSNTRAAAIEKDVYEGVEKGTVKNADDIDAINTKYGKMTSIWFDEEPDLKYSWMQIPHYFNAPTYLVNYVYATLLAETYFAQYRDDRYAFAKRFTALLRNGFNDNPQALLKRFMGIDMNNPKTYEAVFAQQEKYLSDLEELYKAVPIVAGNGEG